MNRHEKAPSAPTLEADEAERKSSRKNVMTNNSTALTADNLPSIIHAGMPVVTTALLAKLYGTDDHNIIKNYTSNDGRFVAGKHFLKLEGLELKGFKDKVTQSDVVHRRAKHLILWTERGAARHAKMLDTNEAWEVFEKLEDSYFKAVSVASVSLPAPVNYTLIGTTIGTDGKSCLSAVLEGKISHLAGRAKQSARMHIWAQVHKAFSVVSAQDIPADQMDSARNFIAAYSLAGEHLPKTEASAAPLSLAGLISPAQRLLVSLGRDGELKICEVPTDAYVMTVPELLDQLNAPNGAYASQAELFDFAIKTMQHLRQRIVA